MKFLTKFLTILIVYYFFTSLFIYSFSIDLPTAKSSSLNNDVVAVYGAEAVSLNPSLISGFSSNNKDEILISYKEFFGDIKFTYISFLKNSHNIGVDFSYFDFGEIEGVSKNFTSNIILFSLSKSFNFKTFQLGSNFYFSRKKIDFYSGDIFNINIAASKRISNFLISLVCKDILPLEFKLGTEKEKLPLVYNLGVGYLLNKLSLFCKLRYKYNLDQISFGVEYVIFDKVYLRSSYEFIYSKLGIGCGLSFEELQINVSFNFNKYIYTYVYCVSLVYSY